MAFLAVPHGNREPQYGTIEKRRIIIYISRRFSLSFPTTGKLRMEGYMAAKKGDRLQENFRAIY